MLGLRTTPLLLALPAAILAGTFCLPSGAHAQWAHNGIPVAPGGHLQSSPQVASDSQGGAYITWSDGREYSTNSSDVYLQRLTEEGLIAPGWPASGVPLVVGPGNEGPYSIAPDGQGGAFIVWMDVAFPAIKIYAQRIDESGLVAPGWPATGVPICLAPGNRYQPKILSDGADGAFVVWDDERETGNSRVYATRLTPTGSIAEGWLPDGSLVIDAPGARNGSVVVPDGTGGIIVAFGDSRDFGLGASVYGTRLEPNGAISPGWPQAGVPILPSGSAVEIIRIVSDGLGGAFVAWCDNRVGIWPINPFYYDIYAQHLLSTGELDPLWPVNGFPVCTAASGQYVFDMTSDGQGGIFLVWEDYRNGYWQPFAQRMRPDGSIGTGWATNGLLISDQFATQIDPIIATDGAGGFYAFWEEFPSGDYEIHAQHLTADAQVAPGWSPSGLPIAAAGDKPGEYTHPRVCSDGRGGAIVAYDHPTPSGSQVYAQRVAGDGPVPALLSLIEADTQPGLVRLRWFAPDAARIQSTVYRRTLTTEWEALGSPQTMGQDYLTYEDRTALPGRTAYRLAYFEGTRESFTEETWLEVPSTVQLHLAGFRPNPAIGGATVAFSLPDAGRATLEVHDVRGRTVFAREVGSLGAGSHVLRIGTQQSLSAGVYWIRLVHPDGVLTAKGIVSR